MATFSCEAQEGEAKNRKVESDFILEAYKKQEVARPKLFNRERTWSLLSLSPYIPPARGWFRKRCPLCGAKFTKQVMEHLIYWHCTSCEWERVEEYSSITTY